MTERCTTEAEEQYLLRLEAVHHLSGHLQAEVESLRRDESVGLLFSQEDTRETMLRRCRECFTAAGKKSFPPLINSDVGMIRLINDIRAFQAEKALIDFFMEYREIVAQFVTRLGSIYERYTHTIYPKQEALFELSGALAESFASIELASRYHSRMSSLRKRMDAVLRQLRFLAKRQQRPPEQASVFLTETPDDREDQASITGGGNYLKPDFCSEHVGSLTKLLDCAAETFRCEETFVRAIGAEISERQERRKQLAEDLQATRAALRKKQRTRRLAQTAATMFKNDLTDCYRERKGLELELSACMAKLESLGKQKELRTSLLQFLNIGMPTPPSERNSSGVMPPDIVSLGPELREPTTKLGRLRGSTRVPYRLGQKRQEIERRLKVEQTARLRTEQHAHRVRAELEQLGKRARKLEHRAANFEALQATLQEGVRIGKAEQGRLKAERRVAGGDTLTSLTLLLAAKTSEEAAEQLDERPVSMRISQSLRKKVIAAVGKRTAQKKERGGFGLPRGATGHERDGRGKEKGGTAAKVDATALAALPEQSDRHKVGSLIPVNKTKGQGQSVRRGSPAKGQGHYLKGQGHQQGHSSGSQVTGTGKVADNTGRRTVKNVNGPPGKKRTFSRQKGKSKLKQPK